MAKQAIKVGDKVRLTGKHLRSTGQGLGSAGLDRCRAVVDKEERTEEGCSQELYDAAHQYYLEK